VFNILTVHCKNIFENNPLLFSLASKELIAVGIVKISLNITELWKFLGQKLSKNCENALSEKNIIHLFHFVAFSVIIKLCLNIN
jgi:hypothetical protein